MFENAIFIICIYKSDMHVQTCTGPGILITSICHEVKMIKKCSLFVFQQFGGCRWSKGSCECRNHPIPTEDSAVLPREVVRQSLGLHTVYNRQPYAGKDYSYIGKEGDNERNIHTN